jgi:hypothetical protein
MPLSIVDNLSVIFNCFFPQRDKYDDIDKKLKTLNGKFDIQILNASADFQLRNLYPTTDHVETWSVFIIGNDKTYVHACVGDFKFPSDNLINHRGSRVLTDELNQFFEPLWEETLKGHQLQFYMTLKTHLYIVNTYPFVNDTKDIIGAIMFIRPFTSERRDSFEGRGLRK